jgi:hypothetical protein
MILCEEITPVNKQKPRKISQICIQPNCSKYSSFNLNGQKAQFCNLHKTTDMLDVKHKLCEKENCGTRAGFNFEDKKSVKFCSKHIEKGMIELGKKTCFKCKKKAIYNFIGEKRGLYCKDHKEKNMQDIENKKCLKCNKQPKFNYPDNKGGILCFNHKEKNMQNVVDKKCENKNCKTAPSFNFENEQRGIFCFLHKLKNMINVIDKKCLECNKSPSFNFANEKTALYCFDHKKIDMKNIVEKKCLECDKRPCFNFANEKTALYCFDHKKTDMQDVVHKKCLECDTRPCFNYPNEKTPLYCTNHKKSFMCDVTHPKCQSSFCEERFYNPKYDGYCMHCFIHTFPDKPVVRNYKTKEKAIKDFIFSHFSQLTWVWDKKIQDGCSQRRPDFLCDLGEKILIVEVDENQHTNYDSTCEIARINNLVQDVYFRPIVMIRINTDSYNNEVGIVKSPWNVGKDGIVRITDEKEWNERLEKLKNTIEMCISCEKPNDLITIHSLFFE